MRHSTKERYYGVPRANIERAMEHYRITEEEYLAHPERYPLPIRGTGFVRGTAAGVGSPGSRTGAYAAGGLLIGGILGAIIGAIIGKGD